MAYLIALGILSLVGIAATVWLLRTDGYGPVPTDHSRVAAVSERPKRSRPRVSAPVAEEARLTVPASATAPITAPLRIIGAD